MNSLILFFKGLLIGIGKIIPGVSGSLIAISLGVYEQAIEKISHFFEHKKESLKYLLVLGSGILLAILLASKLMIQLLNTYYIYTLFVFLGLIVGTIPSTIKKEEMKNMDFLFIGIIVLGLVLFSKKFSLPEFVPTSSFSSFFYIFFLGGIDALTMILPGISGTATFMMLGSYSFVLNLFSNPFASLSNTFCFIFGLLLGILLMIHLVTYCFEHHRHLIWILILSFLFFSVFSMFFKAIDGINQTNLLSLFLLFIISFYVIQMITKEE